jgi:DNA-binding transcriptional ArsR family regulator
MDTFVALAHPTRRQIIESLCQGDCSFGDLAQQFEMSRPAVSQHLKVLRETGLVTVRTDAQRRIYSMHAAGFDEIDAWLERTRQFWALRLKQLEQALRGPAETNGDPR